MKEIKLSNHHELVLVDDDLFEELNKYKWHLTDSGYAARSETAMEFIHWSKAKSIKMHHMIMGKPEKGFLIDHIDRNKLNNQKINLRFVNKQVNSLNRELQKNNTSGFRGVHKLKRSGRWLAYIKVNGKRFSLGSFLNKEDAARAYNEAALTYFGEFATLNKVEDK